MPTFSWDLLGGALPRRTGLGAAVVAQEMRLNRRRRGMQIVAVAMTDERTSSHCGACDTFYLDRRS